MSIELITILMFAALIVLLVSGLPIVFCLGSVGIIFAYFLWGPAALGLVSNSMFGMMSNFILIAVPLFIFLAYMLQYSGIGENLYEMMHRWFGPLNGGLAMGTVIICAIVAAISGLSAAGTLSMGVIALPAMLKRGYNKTIAIGSVMAGGALGSLIPPSVPLIIYGFLTGVSVGRLFLGGILPGLMLTVFYVIYVGIRSFISPELGPALPPAERATWSDKISSLRMVVLPVLLIIAILGSIFTGMATPTEAAAVGAFGGIICALVNRRFTWGNLKLSVYGTLKLTGMVMWIMTAASVFTSVYTGLGASQLINDTIRAWGVSPWLVIIAMQVTLFVLGMIMDPNGIMLITVPIYVPIVVELGFDPVWFGILFIINMECAYLTPPFGWNIFYIRGIAPKGTTTLDIYRAVWAFVGLQVLGLVTVMLFPQITLWLPNMIMG